MKLGIVGAGMIVNDLLQCVHEIDIELTGICATKRNVEHLVQLADEHGFKNWYTDYDEMLENEEIDTIYVAVPNYLHYRYGLKALQAGKNVIMEKPFTSNRRQAAKLYEVAEEKGLVLIEAITTLYLPTYEKLRELLGDLGELKIVTLNFTQYSSKYEAFKQGIIRPAFDVRQSGGAMMDLNIYNIHFTVGLFGKPLEAAYLPNMERGVDTSGILTMKYPDFQAVLIRAKDCGSPYTSALQGNKGCIWFDGPPNFLNEFSFRKGKEEPVHIDRENVHRMKYEFEKFREVIDSKNLAFASKMKQETMDVMSVVDMAKKSAGIVFEDDANL